jgi:NADPH2:quinone reductase
MPKALRFHALGGPEVLRFDDVPVRKPAEGEVLIAVEAVGLNRAESMYYHGEYFEQPSLPSGIGYEAVGRVVEVGPGGDPSIIGTRVGTIPGYSMNRYPVLAEEAVVPIDVLAPVPESYSVEDGAAVWMQYATAYGALVPFGQVGPGDAVLITAASSSVGLAAIQIVRAQGGISIATTRTSAKKAELLALGADHVIVTGEEDLVARVHEVTDGQGVRVAFDSVGGEMMNAVGAATATGGVIFFFGMLGGGTTPFPLTTFGRRIAVYGYTFLELKGTASWDEMKRYIFDRLSDGTFQPRIAQVFPFAEAVEAYRFLESNQQIGKVVVRL